MAPYKRVAWKGGLPEITTARLTLRIAEEKDLSELLRFAREEKEHFRPWFPVSALDPTPAALKVAIADRREQAIQDRGYRFHLFPLEEPDRVIGLCSIADVRRGAIQQGVLGYGLAHERQGYGLMTEAARAAVAFAFQDLDLHRLEGSYMPTNDRSAAVLKSLGFVEEGFFKDYLLLAGAWQDHVVTSLLNPAWRGVGRTIQD